MQILFHKPHISVNFIVMTENMLVPKSNTIAAACAFAVNYKNVCLLT